MFPTDRPVWSDARNRPQYKESVQLPEGWCWDGDWEIDMSDDNDADGWAYGGFSWKFLAAECTATSFVRRRRWLRVRRKVGGGDNRNVDTLSDIEQSIEVVDSANTNNDHRIPPPIVSELAAQQDERTEADYAQRVSSDDEIAIE